MRSTRRAFVTGLAAARSGCLGGGSAPTPTARPDGDDDGVPDDMDEYPTDDRRGHRSSSSEATTTIEAGDFRAIGLTNSPQDSGEYVDYDVTVEGEGTVDCLVFRREEYDAYEQGARDTSPVAALSRTDVSEAKVVGRLPEGQFIFSLDYTEQTTEPDRESVTVTYSIEMADPVSTDSS